MPRRLTHLLGAITFLPLLLVIALWFRSHSTADRFNTRYTDCAIARGEVMIASYTVPSGPGSFSHHTYPPSPGHFNWHEDSRAKRYLNVAGFAFASLPSYTPPSIRTAVLIFPIWSLALVASLPPALYLRRVRRAHKRRGENQCAHCGYDLRATPDRCPECGAIPITAT